MSQRIADEIENRRGLVLGLTLAELLLLLLFLLLLALGWRMTALERQAAAAKANAERTALENIRIRATLRTLEPLLAELNKKGGLDAKTAADFIARLSRLEALERENAELLRSRSELMAEYIRFKAIMPDSKATRAIEEALAAAAQIDPNDPPAVLVRAAEVLRNLGVSTQPEQIRLLAELRAIATRIDPANPTGAVANALEIAKELGPNATPEQIKALIKLAGTHDLRDKFSSLEQERDKYKRALDQLTRGSTGLTLPSCWHTAESRIEYMFDITIRDDGLIVRDATPARSDDPQMKMVQSFDRDVVINEGVFQRATVPVFNWSQEQKCRFYAIVRDGTGPTSKARYKELRTLVESHFYPSLQPLTPGKRPRSQQDAVGGPSAPPSRSTKHNR